MSLRRLIRWAKGGGIGYRACACPGRRLGASRPSSGMLRRYRRFFAVAAFLLLASPLVAGLVYPDGAASILMEGRTPAPVPGAPVDSADWFRLSKQIDAYLQDHFGL